LASRDKFDREYRAIIATLQRRRKAAGMTQWDLGSARWQPSNAYGGGRVSQQKLDRK